MKFFQEKISIKETNILLKVDNPKFFKSLQKQIHPSKNSCMKEKK